jgi:hypothetical protein
VAKVVCEAYDRVEIARIEPDVTRVSLFGGVCPCCARRFKAAPSAGLEPGSPFGHNLRAFVIYLRAVQGMPRPSDLRHPICHRRRRTMLGPGFKGLLNRACAIGRRRADLTDGTLRTYEADLNRRLDRMMALVPTHQAGLKLMQIIKKVRRHLFVFVQNRELSANNNGSERAMRPCAVYRKITNGFRSEWGAARYADIRSVVETARRRAVRAIDAIRLTLKGQHIPVPA